MSSVPASRSVPRSGRGLGSFRRQIVVLAGAVTAVAAVLLALLVQLLLASVTSGSVSRVLSDRADAVISSADAGSSAATLVVPDSRLDAGVAVYDSAGGLVAGAGPRALGEEYAELSRVDVRRTVTADEADQILAQPFTTSAGASGVVVVTERLAPYEQSEHFALLVSIVAGLLMVGAAATIAGWVAHRALVPVAEMAATAEDWSEHDLARRFDLGPPANELAALGHTLDGLLDKVSGVIRSEQRLTSELAHELRTPLTSVRGSADLLLMRADLTPEVRAEVEEMRLGTVRMSETIAGLLELARTESSMAGAGTARLADVVAEAVAGAAVETDVPGHVRVGLPHALAVRALTPVVANAVREGSRVRVAVRPGPAGFVSVLVEDDGPGVAEGSREAIFTPGHTTGQGAGLGLSLARRIARSSGGEVVLEPDDGVTRFVIRLPLA